MDFAPVDPVAADVAERADAAFVTHVTWALERTPGMSCRVTPELVLADSGAAAERAGIGRAEFEKAVGRKFDLALSHDAKSAAAATNAGQPVPAAAPRSPLARDFERLAAALRGGGSLRQKRRIFGVTLG